MRNVLTQEEIEIVSSGGHQALELSLLLVREREANAVLRQRVEMLENAIKRMEKRIEGLSDLGRRR